MGATMALVGADVEALRALARTLTDAAERLDGTGRAVTGALSQTRWAGNDAERFRADWHQLSRGQLSSAASALREAAQALQRNALEQEQARSAAGGSAAAPSPWGSTPGQPIGAPD